MLHDVDILSKLRFILIGVLVFVSLLLLVILVIGVGTNSVGALNSGSSATVFSQSSSPNAVQSGLGNAAYEFNRTMTRTARSLNAEIRSMAVTTAHVSNTVLTGIGNGFTTSARTVTGGAALLVRTTGGGVAFLGHTASDSTKLVGSIADSSASFLARTASDSIALVVQTPGKMIGAAMNIQSVSSIIKPVEHMSVPIIDPNSPALAAAQKAMAAPEPRAHSHSMPHTKPRWPIHGAITTLFGVPHWPFQSVHTGLDISDGKAPGTTPVKPFKPGKVIEIVHSNVGLGNHVTIDHGSGVTSVYGHLNSISVHKGQRVSLKTLVGYEGSSGASTGSHLHLEIRVHGEAADPLKFISGRP